MADYAIEICVHTGLRVGEVAALRWDCIANGELLISQSEHRVDHDDSASIYEIGATKNGKERRIPISDSLQAVFDRIYILQEEHGIHSDYIIADNDGRVIAPTISKAMYHRGVEANIKAKIIHALRRTVSSKLNSRLPSATVALIMGHTEEVNQNHYNYDIVELKSQYHQLCWWFEITPPGSSVVPPKGGLANLVHYVTGSRLKAALLTSPERSLLPVGPSHTDLRCIS